MRRQVGRLVSETTEVDDLADTRSLGLARRRRRRDAIPLVEVSRAERMDEVVHDIDALEGTTERLAVRDVGRDTAYAVRRRRRTPGDGDDIVPLGQQRHQGAADHTGGAEHGDLHRAASVRRRAKYRRPRAT